LSVGQRMNRSTEAGNNVAKQADHSINAAPPTRSTDVVKVGAGCRRDWKHSRAAGEDLPRFRHLLRLDDPYHCVLMLAREVRAMRE